MTERELFARSYAQYIALRSGDHVLLNQLDEVLKEDTVRDIVIQWSVKDFMPVGQAFDILFRKQKWLR